MKCFSIYVGQCQLGFGFVMETIELFYLSYVSLSNLHQVKIKLFPQNKKDNIRKVGLIIPSL